MGKKAKPKIEVTLYYMSIHYGACVAADAIRAIIIKEKLAWEGYQTSATQISINKKKLFGGEKKEGGAIGSVYWLPGADDQILPDALARRLGRSSGLDTPGYRGIATAFFVGNGPGSGTGLLGSLVDALKGGMDGGGGFYWSANVPYLPGTWLTLERAPRGMSQTYVRIPRSNIDEFPFEIPLASGPASRSFQFGPTDEVMAYWGSSGGITWFSLSPRTVLATNSGPGILTGSVRSVALDSSGTAYFLGDDFGGACFCTATVSGSNKIDIDDDVASRFFDTTRVFEGSGSPDVYTSYEGTVGYVHGALGVVLADSARDFCEDGSNDIIAVCQPDGATDAFSLVNLTTSTVLGTYTGTVARADISTARLFYSAFYRHFLVWMDDYFYTIDDTTFLIKTSGAFNPSGSTVPNFPLSSEALTFWDRWSERSVEDCSVVRTIDPSLWVATVSEHDVTFDPWFNALWSQQAAVSPPVFVRELDRGIYDANPAHIIYECLTNTDWGMGSPESAIDIDSFEACGVTLYNEGLGLSMIWTRQAAIQAFVQEVLDHAQAVLFVDPQTGLLTLKLIRADYDIDTLPEINPQNAVLKSFGRKVWGEIVNEINVSWTNPDNEQEETVTVQDLGSIATQGAIVSDSRNYYGVRTKTVAQQLGARDLRAAGAPLAALEVDVNRELWFLRPASVLTANWPEYGLDGVVCRVVDINYGRPGDPEIGLSLIEDVFALDQGDYIEPPGSAWEDPSEDPEPLEIERVMTLPLFFAGDTTAAAYIDPVYPDVLAGILGTTSQADALNAELWDEITLPDGSLEWQEIATNNIIGHAELAADVPAEVQTTISTIDNFMGGTAPTLGGFVIIGDDGEELNEIALVTAAGTSVTVLRGVLDTVPRAWPAGTPVWFVDGETLFEDPLIRSAGEEVSYKMLTATSQGTLSLAAAPLVEYTLTERPWLPNRPADAKVDGVAFNDFASAVDMTLAADVPVTWANRNRLLEETQVLAWDDATVVPETGQTTTLQVLSADGLTVLDTIPALSGTSYNVPISSFGSETVGRIRFLAERTDSDGTFESLQGHDIYVRVAGELRVTEDSDDRLTEDGDVRVLED